MAEPWLDTALPRAFKNVPAQLSLQERRYLVWVTASAFTGAGCIVELGTLLGGSSCAMAEGLRRARRKDRILALDRFCWWGDELRPEGVQDGDDFMKHYLTNTRKYAKFIDPRRQDLLESSYEGPPIEILFVDAGKSWELLNAILRTFGPHLIPGVSRVVMQDFRALAYWHILIMDRFPDLWEEVESVKEGDTSTFRPRDEASVRWCVEAAYSDGDFPWDTAWPVFERRIAAAAPEHANGYRRAALVKALVEQELGAAAELASKIRHADTDGTYVLRPLQRGAGLLAESLWNTVRESGRQAAEERIERLQDSFGRLGTPEQAVLQPVQDVVRRHFARSEA